MRSFHFDDLCLFDLLSIDFEKYLQMLVLCFQKGLEVIFKVWIVILGVKNG